MVLFLLEFFVGSLLCLWSACVGRLYHDYNGDRSATFSPQKPNSGRMSSGRMAINAYNMCSQQTDWKQENGVVFLGRALLSLVRLIELLQFFSPDVMLISWTLRTRCNITPTSLSRYDQSSKTVIHIHRVSFTYFTVYWTVRSTPLCQLRVIYLSWTGLKKALPRLMLDVLLFTMLHPEDPAMLDNNEVYENMWFIWSILVAQKIRYIYI